MSEQVAVLIFSALSLVIAVAAMTVTLLMPKLLARQKAKYDRIAEEDLKRFREERP